MITFHLTHLINHEEIVENELQENTSMKHSKRDTEPERTNFRLDFTRVVGKKGWTLNHIRR